MGNHFSINRCFASHVCRNRNLHSFKNQKTKETQVCKNRFQISNVFLHFCSGQKSVFLPKIHVMFCSLCVISFYDCDVCKITVFTIKLLWNFFRNSRTTSKKRLYDNSSDSSAGSVHHDYRNHRIWKLVSQQLHLSQSFFVYLLINSIITKYVSFCTNANKNNNLKKR